MVKKLCIVLLMLLLPLVALADAQVMDRAGVLTVGEEQGITEKINEIEKKHQVDVIVLTTTDTPYDGTDDLYYVRRYADDFYDNGDYGMGQDDSGILVLLDMRNWVIYLSTGGVMMEYINDSREEAILDDAYYYLSRDSYAAGLMAAVEKIGSYMDKGRAEGTFLYDEVTGQRISGIHNALTGGEVGLAAAVGAAVAAFFGITVSSGYNLKGSTYHYSLSEQSTFSLDRNDETFLHKSVSRTVRHQNSSSSAGRSSSPSRMGGSGVHRSSGGVRHGGGGRRF